MAHAADHPTAPRTAKSWGSTIVTWTGEEPDDARDLATRRTPRREEGARGLDPFADPCGTAGGSRTSTLPRARRPFPSGGDPAFHQR